VVKSTAGPVDTGGPCSSSSSQPIATMIPASRRLARVLDRWRSCSRFAAPRWWSEVRVSQRACTSCTETRSRPFDRTISAAPPDRGLRSAQPMPRAR
jgi:hypothetical protein